ncbi:MAG TPA: WecB/TagA/CpsF family glycosyltransferase, partial [Candidatus Baltobacteraceae bacterium]|nr:WecB/TagA/CpsF family glycosyltransferase [Candidatus Baltobacteraceae bacterium]
GCRLDTIDAAAAAERVAQFARSGSGELVVTLGTEMVVYAQRDERFRSIVNASALSLCDTVGLLAVARRRGAALDARVTGVELVVALCKIAARDTIPVYFLGGDEGVAADAAAILEARFPGLNVAGIRNGFFTQEQTPAIVDAIRASKARLLFVGLGTPRQEFWLAEHLSQTGAGAGVGVGGSFDVLSGRVSRAPYLWRRLGVEWLYRLLRDPRRWRRQLALPYFVWLVTLERLGITSKKGVHS